MLFKKKMQVVPENQFTDYSERFNSLDEMRKENKYATRKDVAVMASIPALGAIGLFAYNKASSVPSTINESIAVQSIQQPIQMPTEPITTLVDTYSSTTIPVMAIPQQTGVIADKSLEILAAALDPVVQILVAISFPIASVIMVGACFFFMLGNTEKAWSMIMNAGLGYVLIQLSPLFLNILRTVGEAV